MMFLFHLGLPVSLVNEPLSTIPEHLLADVIFHTCVWQVCCEKKTLQRLSNVASFYF